MNLVWMVAGALLVIGLQLIIVAVVVALLCRDEL